MADDLLLAYASPGPVDPAEFTDWYNNEHIPSRLVTPGFGAVSRFRALDGLEPEWLTACEIEPGTPRTPAGQVQWDNQSERDQRIRSAITLDRRFYSLLSDSWADGVSAASEPPPVIMTVSMSVPADVEPELDAYYNQEHYPLLLAVPGWRRARRYVLSAGSGPKYLSLHEIDSQAAFDEPGYKAATSTPWRDRIVGSATEREKRVFGLHKAFR